MARRRSPLVLDDATRAEMIAAADADPALRADIETVLGVSWDRLTGTQKIGALNRHAAVGTAAAQLAAAAAGVRELRAAAQTARDEAPLADQVDQLVAQNRDLAAQIQRLTGDNERLRRDLTALRAEPARAIHSGEDKAA